MTAESQGRAPTPQKIYFTAIITIEGDEDCDCAHTISAHFDSREQVEAWVHEHVTITRTTVEDLGNV